MFCTLQTTAAAPARQYVQQKSQLVIAVQTSRPTPLATVAPPPTSGMLRNFYTCEARF